MKRLPALLYVLLITGAVLLITGNVTGQDRFPRPEFQNGYTQPQTVFPDARAAVFTVVDIAALIVALSVAAYFALRRRSRAGIFVTMAASVAYFGFYRKGCICPVGSLQNVTAAWADPAFMLPAVAVVFFAVPLLFALLFGRVFCAAVCPLGAVQDLVVFKPRQLPGWMESVLGLLPHLYLGTAVLFAATGTGFLICRFDPFVAFFRFGGPLPVVIFGLVLLATGLFVARPYCRFLCPYGILLGWMSQLSQWHATITPDECINCRLCENACPFGAIIPPTPPPGEPWERSRRRLVRLVLLVPFVVAAGAGAGYLAHNALAQNNADVRLASRLVTEEATGRRGATLETQTFRAGTESIEALISRADRIKKRFTRGSMLLGGYLGAVIAFSLIGTSLLRRSDGYLPHRRRCLSCGRCFAACPKEQVRLKKLRTARSRG